MSTEDDFLLLRTSLISLDSLSKLSLPMTKKAIGVENELKQKVEENRADVCAILFRAVPKLPAEQRRIALSAKRQLHNDVAVPREDLTSIAPWLSQEENICLRQDYALRVQCMVARRLTSRTYKHEMEMVSQYLWDLIAKPSFLEAFSLSSHDLWNSITRNIGLENKFQHDRHRRQVETTVSRYLYRAAGKTTPLGLWCGVVPGMWSSVTKAVPMMSPPRTSTKVSLSYLRSYLGERIVPPYPPTTGIVANPTTTRDNGSTLYWRRDFDEEMTLCEIPDIGWVHAAIDAALAGSSLQTLSAIVCADAQCDADVAEDGVYGLIAADVLRADLEPPYGSPAPARHLAALAMHVDAQDTGSCILDSVEARLAAADAVSEPRSRLEVRQNVEAELHRLLPTFGENTLQVDSRSPWAQVSLNRDVRDSFMLAYSRYLGLRSELYGRDDPLQDFRQRFRAEFGDSRAIPLLRAEKALGNPLGPVRPNTRTNRRVWVKPKSNIGSRAYEEFLSTIMGAIPSGNLTSHSLEVDLSGICSHDLHKLPAWTEVVFQHAQRDQGYLIRLEMINAQVGRLAGRFATLMTPMELDSFRKLIRKTLPPSETALTASVILTTGGENDTLSFDLGVWDYDLEIYGPRSRLPRDRVITAGECYLRYDPESDSLRLLDANGRTVMPWFSSTISTRNDSLTTILNFLPYQNQALISGQACNLLPQVNDDTRHIPRITWGPLIVSLEQWYLRPNDIEWRNTIGADGVSTIRQSDNLQRKYGIPSMVYVRTDVDGKPTPIALDDPWCVWQLGELARKAQHYVHFQEALPGIEDSFLTNAAGNRYKAEVWTAVSTKEVTSLL